MEIIQSDFLGTVQLLADVKTTVETMKKEMKGTSKDFLEVENKNLEIKYISNNQYWIT